MKIIFSPQRNDAHVGYVFNGEAIIVAAGGVVEEFDFTGTPDGEVTEIEQGALPSPVVLHASRDAGELTVTLILTHGHDTRAPEETRFPNNPYTPEAATTLLAARDAALEAKNV